MSVPRVVIGIPAYGKAPWLGEALASLLGQTARDLALVLVDDGSPDETVAVARAAAARDPRLEVHVNPQRLGMLGNTNRALALARERFPDAPYVALGSDHDVWDPRWLETLAGLLDADPEVVLAYPLTRRIDEAGAEFPGQKPPWRLDTRGIGDPRARMRHAFRRMAAGDMIYGVFRAEALDRVGGYRPVLVPDRLLLSELALHGTFAQAPEVLWRRRFRGLASLDRQRAAFFLAGAPPWAHLPWWMQHAAAFAWSYGVREKGAELGLGRAAGLRLAVDYLDVALRHRAWRRARRARRRVLHARNALLAPPVRLLVRSRAGRRLARGAVLPGLRLVEDVLERHAAGRPPASLDAWSSTATAPSARRSPGSSSPTAGSGA